MLEHCPLCAAELLGAASSGEGPSADEVLDCPSCGLLRLDAAASAMITLAEPEELAGIAARLRALRATGDRTALTLRPGLFVMD